MTMPKSENMKPCLPPMVLPIKILLGVVLLATASCRPLQVVGGNDSQSRYRNVASRQKDSVFIHVIDSVVIHGKGDTVFFDRWRVRYRDRWLTRTDTVRILDSVNIEKPVLVEKPLSGWTNFQLWAGRFAIVLLVFLVAYRLIRRHLGHF